jgi:hypothetical protein
MACFFSNQALVSDAMMLKSAFMISFSLANNAALTSFSLTSISFALASVLASSFYLT